MADAFMSKYFATLGKLGQRPEKLTINELTMLAGDVAKNNVRGVRPQDLVGAIESRLLRAGPNEKLPIVYLMDSIMFNVRREYPRLFGAQMQSVFMDAFRNGDDRVQASLRKLLKAWGRRRPEHGALDARVLGELHRKLDPGFDVEKFVAEQTKLFGPQAAAGPPPSLSSRPLAPAQAAMPSAPQGMPPPQQPHHGHAPLPPQPGFAGAYGGAAPVPPVPSPHAYGAPRGYGAPPAAPPPGVSANQAPVDQVLHRRVMQVLEELQASMGVPPADRIAVHELESHPVLKQQVYDQARSELQAEGAYGHMGGPPPPQPPPPQQQSQQPPQQPQHAALPVSPSMAPASYGAHPAVPPMYPGHVLPATGPGAGENWTNEWLRDASGASTIALALAPGAVENGPFRDPASGAAFSTQQALETFRATVGRVHHTLNQRKPKDVVKLFSRNWFNTGDEWAQGKDQVLIVDGGGFEDDAVEEEEEKAGEPGAAGNGAPGAAARSMEEDARCAVPVDERFTSCALSGHDFERYFDDDTGQWMYKNTVRPTPDGPIYLISAYREHQAKRKREGEGSDPPAKRAAA